MRIRIAGSLTLACVLALAARSDAQSGTFSIARIVACEGVVNGQPVGPTTQFPADIGRIFIWFEATPAPRDIALRTEWYINGAHVDDASYDLMVDRGANSGHVSLGLPAGTRFPVGDYRVELTSSGLVLGSHRFSVRSVGAAVSAPAPPTPSGARPTPVAPTPAVPGLLRRPEQGFAIAIPADWIETSDQDAAASIVQESRPDVRATIFVQKEAALSKVTDVLAKAAVKLKSDKDRTFLSSSFDVVLDRPALLAVLEDQTTRYKLTLLPREEEDASQIYYLVITMAPRAAFGGVEPTLDRVAAGFQILPMAESARASAVQPAVKAVPPAIGMLSPGASPAGFDRAKVIERILAPHPARKPDDRH